MASSRRPCRISHVNTCTYTYHSDTIHSCEVKCIYTTNREASKTMQTHEQTNAFDTSRGIERAQIHISTHIYIILLLYIHLDCLQLWLWLWLWLLLPPLQRTDGLLQSNGKQTIVRHTHGMHESYGVVGAYIHMHGPSSLSAS